MINIKSYTLEQMQHPLQPSQYQIYMDGYMDIMLAVIMRIHQRLELLRIMIRGEQHQSVDTVLARRLRAGSDQSVSQAERHSAKYRQQRGVDERAAERQPVLCSESGPLPLSNDHPTANAIA